MGDLLRLVRIQNLVIAAAGVVGGGWIALGRIGQLGLLLAAGGVGMAIGAYGYIRNDIDDAPADRANRPQRPIASGRIDPRRAARYGRIALLAAVFLTGAAVVQGARAGSVLICLVAAWAVMTAYSRYLKRVPGVGNVAVALVAGLPLFFGAAAVGRPAAGLVPWALAAWIHLIREIVKDVEDESGDRLAGRGTLPLALGTRQAELVAALVALGFVPVSLVLPHASGYRATYVLIALPAQLVVLAAASRLVAGRIESVSRMLKAAMVIGIVALVAGRLA